VSIYEEEVMATSQTTEPTTEQLLDTEAVARWVGVAPQTLRLWRVQGEGPKAIRIGRRAVRYVPADVRAWLRDRYVDGQ
jgi:predicted DNA-binding transcriptional regulator AlpA